MACAATPKVLTIRVDAQTWIDLSAIASTHSLPLHWNLQARRLELGQEDQMVAWTEGIPWAASDDSATRIEASPRLMKGTWWAPLRSTLRILGNQLGGTLIYDSVAQTTTLGSKKDFASFKFESKKESEIASIRLTHKATYETQFHPPNYVLRIHGVHNDTSLFKKSKLGKLVKKISTTQDKDTLQVAFQLAPGVEDAEVVERESGLALQVIFHKPDAVAEEEDKPAKKQIKTIVIDPGHGGKDPGAVWKNAMEKDVVLAVGIKLRDKLRKAGFNAKMTRDDDNFIELQDRPAMASKWKGDLFVSLHCNAVEGEDRRKKTDGFRVYILREAESEEDKAIARRENKAAELSSNKRKSEISPVEWILLENQLNQFTKESERLAASIVETYGTGPIRKLGTGAGQAGFMVLVGAFMPAVLVELGFITNAEDEVILMSEKGQDEAAERLTKSIVKYRELNN